MIFTDLTPIQKDILSALINIYRRKDSAVKGEEIAALIDRNPGTIRNQMQLLKALALVEGVPGPKGGYRPTRVAYEAMDIDYLSEEAVVPVFRNGEIVQNTTAVEISLTTVRSPDKCNGVFRIIGNVKEFNAGDHVQIGPTPVNRLVVRGDVFGRDDSNNVVLIEITEMMSFPKKSVRHYMRPLTDAVHLEDSIRDVSACFLKCNVNGSVVEDRGKIVGVITKTDIIRSICEGRPDDKVKDMMTRELITVDGEMQLYDVVKLFQKYNIGQLVVTVDGTPRGVLSKTDVLNESALF